MFHIFDNADVTSSRSFLICIESFGKGKRNCISIPLSGIKICLCLCTILPFMGVPSVSSYDVRGVKMCHSWQKKQEDNSKHSTHQQGNFEFWQNQVENLILKYRDKNEFEITTCLAKVIQFGGVIAKKNEIERMVDCRKIGRSKSTQDV